MSSRALLTKEEIALIQLKDRILDLTCSGKETANFRDDFYLLRWLKAENMNAGKAEQRIRNSVKWRREIHAYSLAASEPPQDLMWNYPFLSDAVDNNGLPVYCISPGSWDLRKIVESGQKERFVKYINQMYLRIEDHMIKINQERNNKYKNSSGVVSGRAVASGVVIIINLKGYNRHQISSLKTVETALELATNYGHYFPELAEKVYFINGSRVFTILLKMLKPLLNLKCIEVYDSNEAHWKPAILSRISPDQLKPEFGGTKHEICSITITPCEDIVPEA